MSTLTADPPTTSHAATPPAAAQVQPTFAGVVRGEWSDCRGEDRLLVIG